jgi:Uma2 family endonuclease
MSATMTLVTAEELMRMPDDGYRYELIKGEVLRMPPTGGEHGVTTMKLGTRLARYVEEKGLGVVFAAETGFKIATDPDTVRAPDAAFVRRERVPPEGVPKGYWPGAPDLAVEVVSPHDAYTEVEEKVFEWIDAGAQMVIVVNPRRRTVTVYRSREQITVLGEGSTLGGGDVLPGFSCQVSELFA